MFRRIVTNEWRNLFAGKSFPALAAVFALLLGYAIFNGAQWVDERGERSRSIIASQEKDLAEKREKTARGERGSTEPGNFQPDPSDAYALGMGLYTAVLPFAPTAVFSIGQADVLSAEAGVTVSTLQRTKADKTGFENPLSFLAGRFDFSFATIYLLPLFILALSFNLLSNEREQGILQLILSQPVKLENLLAAKIAAHFVFLFGFVSLVSLVGIFLVAGEISADFLGRTLLWIVAFAGYSLFWLAFAAFINSFGYSSATNAVIAAAGWLMLVLILPALLNVLISTVYPVPSRAEMVSAVRSVNLDTRKDGKRLLAEHYQDHPELMPKEGEKAFEDFALAFVYIQREQKKRAEQVEEKFADAVARQQNLVRSAQFLSPSIIAQEVVNDLAGTGLSRYAHFRAQVKRFDESWTNFFLPRIYRKEALAPEDFDRIPRFRYVEESFAAIFGRVAPGIAFLFFASGVLLFAALRRLKTY